MFFDTEDFKDSVLSYYEVFSNSANDQIYFLDFHSIFKAVSSDRSLDRIDNFPELLDVVFKKYFE